MEIFFQCEFGLSARLEVLVLQDWLCFDVEDTVYWMSIDTYIGHGVDVQIFVEKGVVDRMGVIDDEATFAYNDDELGRNIYDGNDVIEIIL